MTRSIKKGFFVDPDLMKKVTKAQESGDENRLRHGPEDQRLLQTLLA